MGATGGATSRSLHQTNSDTQVIHVIGFKRLVKKFSEALVDDPALKACHEELAAEGLATRTPKDTLIFAEPELMQPTIDYLKQTGVKLGGKQVFWHDLKPWQVVASERYKQAVRRIAYRFKGKHQVKPSHEDEFPVAAACASSAATAS